MDRSLPTGSEIRRMSANFDRLRRILDDFTPSDFFYWLGWGQGEEIKLDSCFHDDPEMLTGVITATAMAELIGKLPDIDWDLLRAAGGDQRSEP